MKMEHMAENKDLGEAFYVQDMKEYEEVEMYVHSFLTSALDGRKWSASRSGLFNPGNIPLVPVEWKAVWPQSPLNKKEISCTCQESNHEPRFLGCPSHSQITQ
jgi:hypothetical protein